MNDLAKQLFCGGVGCGVAGFVTNPMDVVKTRNQQQGGEKYGSFRRALRSIVADEGASGLLKGARASVLRPAAGTGSSSAKVSSWHDTHAKP